MCVCTEFEEDITRRLEIMTEIYTLFRTIIESTHDNSHDSPIWKQLKESYDEDIKVSSMSMEAVLGILNVFDIVLKSMEE